MSALDVSSTQVPASTSAIGRNARIGSWIAQIAAAAILGQTLFFKFTGAPEAVAIFSALGVEPWGRIATGVIELITVAALLIPRTAAIGGVMAVGLMVGAIGAHLTRLGIEVEGDGGTLFVLALITLAAGLIVAGLHRAELQGFARSAAARLRTA